ncbi:DUF167 family protein [uncultured Parvibaculum sp.]|uniref:DUF167 domain-containing protein n=1 Tax=uncultured Parvibaculum sp. TaxID=291828 RepID=UPI0030DB2499
MPGDLPVRRAPDGVLVALKVTPKSGANRIEGLVGDGDGTRLRLRVTAAPEKGKANEAVMKLVAKAWGLPKSSLSIASGETAPLKMLLVRGDSAVLEEDIAAYIRGLS